MATTINYVSFENLKQYDSLLKPYIDGKISDGVKSSIKTIAIDGNTLKFYNVDQPVGETAPVFTIELPETDLSGLIPKIKAAVAGNVVTANADGTVADGGVKLADLAKSADVTKEIGTAKTELEKEITANTTAIGNAKTELEKKIGANTTAIETLNGDNTVEGSVKKQIKDASDVLQTQITANKGVIDKLDGVESVEGSVKNQLKALKDTLEGEITASEYNDTEVRGLITANKTALDTLNGEGAGSVKKAIDDAFNDFSTKVSDDSVVNTYKELIDYAAAHKGEAATMAGDIATNKTAISNLDKKVGVLPEDTDATSVVDYVDKKSAKALDDAKAYSDGLAKNYATAEQGKKADTALQEADVATLRTDVADVKTSLAEGGATANAIAAAKKAGTDAQTSVDELEKRVNTLEGVEHVAVTEAEIKALFATK